MFTPRSFLDVVGRLMALGMVPAFALAAFHATEPGTLEFHASLERLADDLPIEERRRRQEASLAAARASLDTAGAAHAYVLLSASEHRAIEMKRAAMGKMRALVGRGRRLLASARVRP